MNTDDTEVLHKIIDLQSCIIQGRNIKALLHRDREFYLEKTQADIISVYINEDNKMNVEYILEKHQVFLHLMKKYIFSKQNFLWSAFSTNCGNHFINEHKYKYFDSLYDIFKGLITKKSAEAFTKELGFKDSMIMPLYDFQKKEIIGYICFIFLKKVDIQKKDLQAIRTLIETILRPLYDNHYSIIYSKCVRVDEHLKLLTDKEKQITKKILQGKSYPEIAEQLNISINTVKTHVKNIFKRYQVNSKIELYNKLGTMI